MSGGGCFCRGAAYIGTSTVDRKRQKVFSVVARRGDVVSFSHVSGVQREMVEECDGTEIVKIKDADGFDYFLSAQVEVDIDKAFNVVRMCQA